MADLKSSFVSSLHNVLMNNILLAQRFLKSREKISALFDVEQLLFILKCDNSLTSFIAFIALFYKTE